MQLDPALARHRRLAEEQRGERRVAAPADQRAGELLVEARCPVDLLHGVVVAAELDQPADHGQAGRDGVPLSPGPPAERAGGWPRWVNRNTTPSLGVRWRCRGQ